jgi:hypothetical protein
MVCFRLFRDSTIDLKAAVAAAVLLKELEVAAGLYKAESANEDARLKLTKLFSGASERLDAPV